MVSKGNQMTKIRFYHWWAYRLYRWLWTPILSERPSMVKAMRDWKSDWLSHKRGYDETLL